MTQFFFENFVNREEAFFQATSKTLEATEGLEIWSRYLIFFLTISKSV